MVCSDKRTDTCAFGLLVLLPVLRVLDDGGVLVEDLSIMSKVHNVKGYYSADAVDWMLAVQTEDFRLSVFYLIQ